ncbi:hypothetical protein E1176_15615, partial [Fulvivirga sp. RKSG066]|uniref:baseplate J/gp47 family protein n=1 Tax=Fulvivirga aurantia TaxID=2529383 RepID=UPI0012BD3F67
MSKRNNKNIGTSQSSRQFEALDSGYVKIDERSFEDMLVFTSGLSKLINFYNQENKVEGDWSYFFADETVVLASIIDSEPVVMEERFKDYIYKAQLFKRTDRKHKYLDKCFREIHNIASRFEDWYKRLKAIEEFTLSQVSVRSEINNAITSKLKTALQELKKLDVGANDKKVLGKTIALDYADFSEIWELDEIEKTDSLYKGKTQKERIESVTEKLQQIFQDFYETLLYLKSKTPDYLDQSLESDIHYPEIALYIAFLKLFEKAQGNLNQLNRRHIEFYFAEVLRQQKKNAIYDKVYLKFILNQATPYAHINEGTVFIGQKDSEGNNALYIADEDLLVNKVKVKSVKSIYVDSEILTVKGREKRLTNNVLKTSFPAYTHSDSSEQQKIRKSFAVFGEDQSGKGVDEKTMENADIGFAIASPSLFLKEGLREVEIIFQFEKEKYKEFTSYLEDLSIANDNTQDEVFVKIFLESFNISVTSGEEWHHIRQHVINKNDEECFLKINFDLLPTEPAITAFDKSVHGGHFSTSLPVIRFTLNSSSYIYPYSLLANMELEQITFNTKVQGYKSLDLYNNIGQLNPNTPFLPFGPMPKAGSYFVIGSNEIFNKSLDDLKINIEWFDLPPHKSGFAGHYAEYELDIDNATFEASLSILDGGRWKPQEQSERQNFKLFRTQDNGTTTNPTQEATLLSKTVIDQVEIKDIKQSPQYDDINEPLNYTSLTPRGFIKLELSNPQFGFAHDIYPSILSEVTIENARGGLLKNKEKSKKLLPKAPYAPQIQTISVDYASSSSISLVEHSSKKDAEDSRGKFFYLHPFGENLVYPDNSKQKTYLLPDYNFEGSLLLGLSDVRAPQLLTILFEMIDEYTVSSEEDPPVIEWSYLSADEWYTLAPSKILRDDTNRFLKTGIVLLEIPGEITNGNSILDSELYWIRATVTDNINTASNILSITTQVISATLDPNSGVSDKHLRQPLPPFTINRSVENIEGIQTIRQPLPSFMGRPSEEADEFYTRVGERLHHKQRAVTTWDYERIILEKFDEIYKVNCLSNMTSNHLDSPGNVLIVVTPHARYSANPNEPMASSELLHEIKLYIQQFTSPFIKIEVRNPHYERIKIICAVKFTDGFNYGFHIQKLNEQINKYLTGTLLSQNSKVELGGTVHSSDILSFMRTLSYVNFITKFSMIQVARDFQGNYQLIDTAREQEAKSSLSATKPWSV